MRKLNKLAKVGEINKEAIVTDEHSIIVHAPVKMIWKILTDHKNWEKWNNQIKEVNFDGDLSETAKFTWHFDGTKYNSEIQSLEKHKLLSWTGKSMWLKRVVVWELDGNKESTIVKLKTSLEGLFAILTHKNQRVFKELVHWLDSLSEEVFRQLEKEEKEK